VIVRDPKKLKAFELADKLALLVYRETGRFPKEEIYGLTSQMRRAAVSVPSNIAEGCGRTTEKEYFQFLSVAYGSLKELEYQISLAVKLGFLEKASTLAAAADETARVLNGLMKALKK
jgi:four helix bundle protein